MPTPAFLVERDFRRYGAGPAVPQSGLRPGEWFRTETGGDPVTAARQCCPLPGRRNVDPSGRGRHSGELALRPDLGQGVDQAVDVAVVMDR